MPLRGILALGIVLHHTMLPFYNDGWIYLQLSELGCPIVACFFFFSGYGLFKSYQTKGDKYLHGFVSKSLWKLLPAFLIVNSVWVVLRLVVEHESVLEVTYNMTKGLLPMGSTWFVIALIVMYLIYYLSLKQFKKSKFAYAMIIILNGLLAALLICSGWGNYWWVSLMAFSAGIIYELLESKLSAGPFRWRVMNIAFAAIIFFVTLIVFYSGIRLHYYVTQLLVYFLLPIMIPLFISFTGFLRNRVLFFLGIISYEVYLAHGMFLPLIRLPFFLSHRILYFITVLILTIVTAYVLKHMCDRMLERHIHKLKKTA